MQRGIFDPEQYLPGNHMALFTGPDYFVRLLQIIDQAQVEIHCQVYNLEEDHTGREVAAALMKARQRGVQVYLAVDSFGSKALTPGFLAALQEAGVDFRIYSPMPPHYYRLRLGRRLHNKILVADGRVALVTGINFANKYRGNDGEVPWLDFALEVEGPLCVELAHISACIYRDKNFSRPPSRSPPAQEEPAGAMRGRLVMNDWFRRHNQIDEGYQAAFEQAQQSIAVVASYFQPSRRLLTALVGAARRGVQVSILLPGAMELLVAKRATRYRYQELLENNIRLYEWPASILHGKLAVVDQQWVTAGSYNLNHMSQYSSIEMNIEVLDGAFATTVQDFVTALIQQSHPVLATPFIQSRRLRHRVLDWFSYLMARCMMFFLYFLVWREHRRDEKA